MRRTYSPMHPGSATVERWAAKPCNWDREFAILRPEVCMSIAPWPGPHLPLIRGHQVARKKDREEDDVWAVGICRLPSPGMDRAVYRDATHTHAPCVLMIPEALAQLMHESGDLVATWQERLIDCGILAPPSKASLRVDGRAVAFRTVALPGIDDGPASWFVLRGELAALSLRELRKLPPAFAALAHIFRPVFDPYFQRHAPRPVRVPDDWPDHPHLQAPHGLARLKPPMPTLAHESHTRELRRLAEQKQPALL